MSTATDTTVTSQSLITEENVIKALKVDKGSKALLKSWKVVEFTKRGDNYACLVTSVEVKYSTNEKQDCEVTYVVKLNPHRKFGDFQEAEPYIFEKEGKFYEELVPLLNEAIISTGQKPLCFPKCFLVSLEEGKEQIFFEDLRARDFKMEDRRKGLDEAHINLVISELARLHSASHLLKTKLLKVGTISSKYEWLARDFISFTQNSKELFVSWLQRSVDTGVMMLETIGGYETAINWLNSLKPDVEYYLSPYLQSKKFSSVCHGDCWNNNMLFRYDEEGCPVEVMLLDLQLNREASPATDLNYFLYTSVNGDVRRPNLDRFLSLYHSTYEEVLEAGGMQMYFTKEEITEEFRSKSVYGILFALVIIPLLLLEPEEVPEMSDTNFETLMQDFKTLSMKKLKTNPLCKPRFLAIFDEFMESGLIS
ncbi:uncharacterized protein [Palaemon carinicauda]|uniref:uncharacterized protein n=1 Tax=Palaemon carinicauda TaxID=392227 RepID=UPI0035B69EC9